MKQNLLNFCLSIYNSKVKSKKFKVHVFIFYFDVKKHKKNVFINNDRKNQSYTPPFLAFFFILVIHLREIKSTKKNCHTFCPILKIFIFALFKIYINFLYYIKNNTEKHNIKKGQLNLDNTNNTILCIELFSIICTRFTFTIVVIVFVINMRLCFVEM